MRNATPYLMYMIKELRCLMDEAKKKGWANVDWLEQPYRVYKDFYNRKQDLSYEFQQRLLSQIILLSKAKYKHSMKDKEKVPKSTIIEPGVTDLELYPVPSKTSNKVVGYLR